MDSIQQNASSNVETILLGNKIDRSEERIVSLNFYFVETKSQLFVIFKPMIRGISVVFCFC